MEIKVLHHPKTEHMARIEDAVRTVNAVQNYFHFHAEAARWLPHDPMEKHVADHDRIEAEMERRYPSIAAIALIQNPLADFDFARDYRGYSIVSMADWEREFAPPPLKIYLAYQFASAVTGFAADMPIEQIEHMCHKEFKGCLFDATSNRSELRLGLVAGHLCGECEATLAEMGLPDKALLAIEQILTYVRAATIRRPRSTPSHIFIGHGRSKQWIKLRDFLTEQLRVPIEEFNQDPAAGITTVQRLSVMLDRACFALLVMTGEDVHADEEVHARENVIHEIGFFQGRLGFERAIVLRESDVAIPSNIAGLSYISFPKQSIEKCFPAVCQTMLREGVVDMSTAEPYLRARGPRMTARSKQSHPHSVRT